MAIGGGAPSPSIGLGGPARVAWRLDHRLTFKRLWHALGPIAMGPAVLKGISLDTIDRLRKWAQDRLHPQVKLPPGPCPTIDERLIQGPPTPAGRVGLALLAASKAGMFTPPPWDLGECRQQMAGSGISGRPRLSPEVVNSLLGSGFGPKEIRA